MQQSYKCKGLITLKGRGSYHGGEDVLIEG